MVLNSWVYLIFFFIIIYILTSFLVWDVIIEITEIFFRFMILTDINLFRVIIIPALLFPWFFVLHNIILFFLLFNDARTASFISMFSLYDQLLNTLKKIINYMSILHICFLFIYFLYNWLIFTLNAKNLF